MKNQEFISAINYIIKTNGYVSEDLVNDTLGTFDYVDVPTEDVCNRIVFELTLMSNNAYYGRTKDVCDSAKVIREIMRDYHMI